MNKRESFKRRNIVYSLAVVLLICSVSMLVPVNNAQITLNSLNKKHEILKENEHLLDDRLFSLFDIFSNNYFEIHDDLPDDLDNSIHTILDWLGYPESDFKKTVFKKVIPILKEVNSIINNEKEIEQMSSDLIELITLIKGTKQLDLASFEANEKYDFEFYEGHYTNCDNYWHANLQDKLNGRDVWILYTVFGISENTYEDFSTAILKQVRSTFIINLVLIGLSFFIIAYGDNVVDVFGWLLIGAITFYSSLMIAYLFDCHYGFDLCQMTEPDIIIHVVDKNGKGIPGLEIGDHIKAWNVNAYGVCENTSFVDTVWQKKYFTYTLGPVDNYIDVADEEGWYSLCMRKYDKNIYQQAPCPPGKWVIQAGGNSNWHMNTSTIEYVYGKETVLIDNFVLHPTS